MNAADQWVFGVVTFLLAGGAFAWLIFGRPLNHNCERCRLCRKLHERDDHELLENWEVPSA